ncbi:hypothetical protein [Roseibium aggregatum]|uniref:Uncharacterized protein n=1 Tax=Roseibium aggregatum TaxID=187304 RepID=A0A0M6YDD5_9HYPH|nr:hypothetical protein [Roseibium aggregatum]CTQ47724.1 hypothetical protein LAL4801_06193 [Roseibium aggregatum]
MTDKSTGIEWDLEKFGYTAERINDVSKMAKSRGMTLKFEHTLTALNVLLMDRSGKLFFDWSLSDECSGVDHGCFVLNLLHRLSDYREAFIRTATFDDLRDNFGTDSAHVARSISVRFLRELLDEKGYLLSETEIRALIDECDDEIYGREIRAMAETLEHCLARAGAKPDQSPQHHGLGAN